MRLGYLSRWTDCQITEEYFGLVLFRVTERIIKNSHAAYHFIDQKTPQGPYRLLVGCDILNIVLLRRDMRLKSLKEVVKEDPVASSCIFNGLIFNDGALVKL